MQNIYKKFHKEFMDNELDNIKVKMFEVLKHGMENGIVFTFWECKCIVERNLDLDTIVKWESIRF